VPPPGGRAVVVRQGAGLQRGDHSDPLLLRLPGQRGPGRRGCGGRPGGADRHGDHRRPRLLPQPRHLGHHDHREDRRMSARTVISTVRRRLLGVALLTVIVLFLWLTVAIYQGRFTPTVTVSLRTAHVGNQLLPQSDVKVRGLVVGEVREIRTNGDGAVVVLDLHPDKVHLIPRNTTARLLPKTLFGERYVALVP